MNLVRDRALGVYISIPFCRSKCTYCNFASGVYPASEHERYVGRLVQDLAQAGAWAKSMAVELPRRVDSVYLGGGTPSLLAPELVAQLFAALRSRFDLDPDAEITVECAPSQIADETLEALVAAGVNRVSLGVQSFIDREAHQSGRLHSRAIVLDDIKRLRAAGIANLNLDLIAGLAGQTFASWEESLSVLIDAGTPHASVYMLEVDEDSRLGKEMLSGGARYHADLVPTDDAIARMYEAAVERLTAAGLPRYEISNFARPGAESAHNLKYWLLQPYFGFGADAHSFDGQWRWQNVEAAQEYADRVLRGESALASREPARIAEERFFVGLRLTRGARPSPEEWARHEAPISRFIADGLLERNGDVLRLTGRGVLLSNEVFEEFIS